MSMGYYYKIPCLAALLVAAIQSRCQACQSSTKSVRQQPTLDFFPKPKVISGSTPLIWLKNSDKANNYVDWNNKILKTLSKYYYTPALPSFIEKGNSYVKTCSYSEWPNDNEVCKINVRDWGECSRESGFGYHRNSPCIFLKLNQVYGWTPDVYDDPCNLPAEMPKSLQEHIGNITTSERRNNIWVSCEGETPVDKENLGPVQYSPDVQGFPGYYFPFKQNAGYLSPLVAIRLMQPVTGISISIECRTWAKNIKYDKKNGLGYVIFDFLMD